MTPEEYRQKHHRCRWCRYNIKYVEPPHFICADYCKCLVKDKIISELFWNWRGVFCKVYKPKEIDFGYEKI